MKLYTKVFIIGLFLSLCSCAGFGIPNSTNPYKKLDYASLAMNKGMNLPAELLIKGAIEKFKTNNDKEGLAKAYSVYGRYYNFKGWQQSKAPISVEKSVEAFNTAISIYKEIGKNMGAANSYFGLANAYGSSKSVSKQCEAYEYSLLYYEEGVKNEKLFPINSNYANFPQMVEAYKATYCRGECCTENDT